MRLGVLLKNDGAMASGRVNTLVRIDFVAMMSFFGESGVQSCLYRACLDQIKIECVHLCHYLTLSQSISDPECRGFSPSTSRLIRFFWFRGGEELYWRGSQNSIWNRRSSLSKTLEKSRNSVFIVIEVANPWSSCRASSTEEVPSSASHIMIACQLSFFRILEPEYEVRTLVSR